MKVSVLQDQLARALNLVSRAVDTRNTLPVLANVLLTADDSRLRLSATNLELSITTYIGAQVHQQGQITLPAKTFGELVSNLSPERVDLTLDGATQTVNVRCGRTTSNVRGIAAAEFPPVPEPVDPDVIVRGGDLKQMINQTAFCAAREDSRPILTGLYVELDGSNMTMAAADGFRLAVKSIAIDAHFPQRRELVIPARTMIEVARTIVDDQKEVGISLPGDRDLVLFYIDNTVIASQILEGKFPDFNVIIPRTYSTSMLVSTADFLRDCKRAEIFARENNNSARLTIRPPRSAGEPGQLTLSARSSERGDNESTLEVNAEGEVLEASFNIRYLLDVLNVLAPTEFNIIFESAGPSAPGVIRAEKDPTFLNVIMPMASR